MGEIYLEVLGQKVRFQRISQVCFKRDDFEGNYEHDKRNIFGDKMLSLLLLVVLLVSLFVANIVIT